MVSKKLTNKEKAFCKEYIVDFNARRAAEEAGYSEKTARQTGYENLTKHYIQVEIHRLTQERAERLQVSQDRVVQELMKIAFSDITDYVDNDGSIDINNETLSGVIKEYKSKLRYQKTEGSEPEPIIEKEIKLYDKMKALELLGRHLSMYTDNVNSVTEIRNVLTFAEAAKKKK
jgi:phage terminase small subunit